MNSITAELNELGSTLPGVPPVTPYAVPPGFFDEFPFIVLSQVSPDAQPEFGVTVAPYQAPRGYFENLPALMISRIKADNQSVDNELSSLSPLLQGIGKKMPYTVPDNYFEKMAAQGTQNKATAAQPSAGTAAQSPAGIAADDNAVGDVTKVGIGSAVHPANMRGNELSPLMASLRDKNVYSAPAGYFESLPAKLLKRVSADQGGRVVQSNFSRRIFRYAAAAVVAGIMLVVGFFTFNNNGGQAQLASAKNLEEKVAQTSDEDILTYLSTQPAPLADVQLMATEAEIKDDAILEMLADVSDEELQQYAQMQSDVKLMIN
jgi:hypothetical protein